jgi:hypothetical protein
LLVSSFLVPGGGERGKGREGRNVGRLTSAGDEAGNVVIVEAVDALEIPGISRLVGEEEERKEEERKEGGAIHLSASPLHFLHDI